MLALAQRLRLGGGRGSTRQRGTRRDMSEAGMQSLVTSPPSFSFSPRSCPLLTRPPTLTPTRILTNKTLTPWQEMRHIPNEELLGSARGRRYPRGRVASTRVRHVRCVPPPARRLSACRSDETDWAGPCGRVDSAPFCAADDGARGCVTLALAGNPPHDAESRDTTDDDPPRPMLHALRTLKQHCSLLQVLEIMLDASTALPPEAAPAQQILTRFIVGPSPITAPLSVARFLSGIFAHLTDIATEWESRHLDADTLAMYTESIAVHRRWKDVERMLPELLAARTEERDRTFKLKTVLYSMQSPLISQLLGMV
ncbi:hypothetical protein B0H10DRAFT_2239504 [Mycena sp. CBHHK59/15]|nr:hypothetical protein B0H10DRAFT_2239504 [Mycena sp. CBHHK59/15]